jgi:hypothetical protein
MTVDIRKLLPGSTSGTNQESDTAYFLVNVPSVAPLAYFHRVFKPAPEDLLREVGAVLHIPETWSNLLRCQNGANLFLNSIYIHGVVSPTRLLNRSKPMSNPPFDIQLLNDEWPARDTVRLLAIGCYGFDGSNIYLDRNDGQVTVFRRDADRPIASWPSTESWIESEIARLSVLFDSDGSRLAEEHHTVPGSSPSA